MKIGIVLSIQFGQFVHVNCVYGVYLFAGGVQIFGDAERRPKRNHDALAKFAWHEIAATGSQRQDNREFPFCEKISDPIAQPEFVAVELRFSEAVDGGDVVAVANGVLDEALSAFQKHHIGGVVIEEEFVEAPDDNR